MVQEIYDKYIFIYAMAGLCLLGTLLKIMVSRTYKRLIKASDNMGASKHKLIKLMKMKFEACYKLKIGVNNVDSFVDKYVYKHRICGIHLYTWENFGGQLLILCLLMGTVGSVLGLIYKCGKTDILITFFTGVFTSSLLIVVESFINLGAKKSIVKANITDYLENFLKVRLEQENFTPEVLEEYRKEYFKNVTLEETKKGKKSEARDAIVTNNMEKGKKDIKLQKSYMNDNKDSKQYSKEENEDQRKLAKKNKVDKHMETASTLEIEQPKSKKEQDKEMLLRERQFSNRSYQDKNNKRNAIREDDYKQKESNLQPTYPIHDEEDDDEDMRFLIKSLVDTVASTEEAAAKSDKIEKDDVEEKKTENSEEHNKDTRNVRESETTDYIKKEKEDKIIEDILREFLA